MSTHRPDHLDTEATQSLEYAPPQGTPPDTILLISLKEFYPYFKQQHPQIVNRILLSLDINPYNDLSRVKWAQFLTLKRLLLEKTGTLNEKVMFMVQFLMGQKNKDGHTTQVDQVLRVLRLLFLQADDNIHQSLCQLVSHNLQLSPYINGTSITVGHLKALFLKSYLMIDDFISLFLL